MQTATNTPANAQVTRDPLLNNALDAVVHSQPLGSLAPTSSIAQRLNALDSSRPSLSPQAVPQVGATHPLQSIIRNTARPTPSTTLTARQAQISQTRQSIQDHLQLFSSNASPSSARSQQQLRMQIHCHHERSQQRRQQRTVPNDNLTLNQSRQRVVPNDSQSLNHPRATRPYQLSPRVQRNIARNLSMIIRTRFGQHQSGTENVSDNRQDNGNPEINGNQPH